MSTMDCCICLEHVSETIPTECCNQSLHVICLYDLLLNGYRECPLCRNDLNVDKLVNETSFKEYIKTLPQEDKLKYDVEINSVLCHLSKFNVNCCGHNFTFPSPFLYWSFSKSVIIHYLPHIFLLLTTYVCLFLLLWCITIFRNTKSQ